MTTDPLSVRSNIAGHKQRVFAVDSLRVEGGDDGKMPKVIGHAAVFGQLSVPIKTRAGTFLEKIQPGAFKDALSGPDDLVALRQHNPSQVLARQSAQTLKLWEDEKGLAFEFTPPDTTAGRDTIEDIRHGNIKGMSFGFDDPPPGGDSWGKDDSGNIIHTLHIIPLKEISPTPFPAYEGTSLDLRSEQRAIETLETREQMRGSYSSIASACNQTMMQCRSMWELLHNAQTMLDGEDPGTMTDGETQAVGAMHEQMQQLSDKLATCMQSAAPHLLSDDDETDDEDDDPIRSRQLIQRRAELGLRTDEALALLGKHRRDGHMTHNDGTPTVNAAAVSNAESLIAAGKINGGPWSFSTDDEQKMLGASDWAAFAKWHLGNDKNANQKSRDAYKYPFGKAGEVYPAALRAIRTNATKQSASAIYDAAGKLLDAVNRKLDDNKPAA